MKCCTVCLGLKMQELSSHVFHFEFDIWSKYWKIKIKTTAHSEALISTFVSFGYKVPLNFCPFLLLEDPVSGSLILSQANIVRIPPSLSLRRDH